MWAHQHSHFGSLVLICLSVCALTAVSLAARWIPSRPPRCQEVGTRVMSRGGITDRARWSLPAQRAGVSPLGDFPVRTMLIDERLEGLPDLDALP